jgi:hypothetical protein
MELCSDMKNNKKIYLLWIVLFSLFSSNLWSSQVTCIKCKNKPDGYCKYRTQGREIVECFKKCSANPTFGQQGIEACFTAMTILQNPGKWSLDSKKAFEEWYQSIGGENGLATWDEKNKQSAINLMRTLPQNSETPPPVPLPNNFHAMYYLGLNPGLYGKVKDKQYRDAVKALEEDYEKEGGAARKPFLPDNAHPVQLVEGLKGQNGFNALEFLAKNSNVEDVYKAQGSNMTLAQVLVDVEAKHSQKEEEKPQIAKDPSRPLPKPAINAMMYLALNPELLDRVNNMSLKEAIQFLAQQYEQEGSKAGKVTKPDASHRVPGYHSDTRPNGLPNHFNPIEYLALHDDLIAHYTNQNMTVRQILSDAESHYLHFGSLETRTFSSGFSDEPPVSKVKNVKVEFNPMIYLGLHEDLARAFGVLPIKDALERATAHYEQHGKPENRAIVPTTNHPAPPLIPDVAANIKEILPRKFNAAIYLAQHKDVFDAYSRENGGQPKTLNELFKDAAAHYVGSGIGEGRAYKLPKVSQNTVTNERSANLNPLLYLAVNQDLLSAFGNQPANDALRSLSGHYTQHGQGEQRPKEPSQSHPAKSFLPSLSMDAASKLPNGFNIALYLAENPSLFKKYAQGSKTLNVVFQEAASAYVADQKVTGGGNVSGQGKNNEKKDGQPNTNTQAPVFDPLIYLALNKDLVLRFQNLPIKDALEQARIHYETEGKANNRPIRPKSALTPALFIPELMGSPKDFGPGFNPLIYLSLHDDLNKHIGKNGQATLAEMIKEASAHYVQHGKGEGRILALPFDGGQQPSNPGQNKPPEQKSQPKFNNLADEMAQFNKDNLKKVQPAPKPQTQIDQFMEVMNKMRKGQGSDGAEGDADSDDDEWRD